MRLFIAILISFLLPALSYAQGVRDSSTVRKDTTGGQEFILIGRNRYKPCTKWVITGPALNINKFTRVDGNLGLDFHMKINERFFQVGLMRAKEYDGLFPEVYSRLYNEIHVGVGLKEESLQLLYAFFLGPSFSAGEYIAPGEQTITTYKTIGVHTNIEVIYKPVYDVGIGTNLFVDANFRYSVAGVRLVLFLSNSYKGKVFPGAK